MVRLLQLSRVAVYCLRATVLHFRRRWSRAGSTCGDIAFELADCIQSDLDIHHENMTTLLTTVFMLNSTKFGVFALKTCADHGHEAWMWHTLLRAGAFGAAEPVFIAGSAELGSAIVTPWISSETPVDVNELRDYLQGVLECLRVLHGMNFVHGDVTRSNILYDGSGKSSLVDFGRSTYSPAQLNSAVRCLQPTPEYRTDSKTITTATDMFCLGRLANKLICDCVDAELLERCPLLADLLVSMCKEDPVERVTAEDALRHPFFNDVMSYGGSS